MDIKAVFGKNLKKYRKAFNLTQERLAEKIDVSQTFLANVERGNRGVSFETVETLSEFFGVSYTAFFEEDELIKEKVANKSQQKNEKLFYHNLQQKIKINFDEMLQNIFDEAVISNKKSAQ